MNNKFIHFSENNLDVWNVVDYAMVNGYSTGYDGMFYLSNPTQTVKMVYFSSMFDCGEVVLEWLAKQERVSKKYLRTMVEDFITMRNGTV